MTYTPFNPELALRHLYLIDLLEAKVMLGIAKGMAGYICAVNSEDEVAEFLQMVYEEDYNYMILDFEKEAQNAFPPCCGGLFRNRLIGTSISEIDLMNLTFGDAEVYYGTGL